MDEAGSTTAETTVKLRKNVCRSPQKRTLLVATAYDDGCITVWKIPAGSGAVTVRQHLRPRHHALEGIHICEMAIDISGSRLAACSNHFRGHKLFIWDLKTNKVLFHLREIGDDAYNRLSLPSFTKNGSAFVHLSKNAEIYSSLYIINSTTARYICAIDSDPDHCIDEYILVDDDRHILTSGHTQTGELSSPRCWCVATGKRVEGHWTGSHIASSMNTNAAADKILFRCYNYYEKSRDDDTVKAPRRNKRPSFCCVSSLGEVRCSGDLSMGYDEMDFADENTVVTVSVVQSDGFPKFTLLDVSTGATSESAAATKFNFNPACCFVGNGASKVILAEETGIHVLSTQRDEIGAAVVCLEDTREFKGRRIMCAYGVELTA
jgi:hypothetical protein